MAKSLQEIRNRINKLTESILNEDENNSDQKYYVKIYQDWDTDREIDNSRTKFGFSPIQEHRVFYVAKSYDTKSITYTNDFDKAKAYSDLQEAQYVQMAVHEDDKNLNPYLSSNLGNEYYTYRITIIDQDGHEINSLEKGSEDKERYGLGKMISVNVIIEGNLVNEEKIEKQKFYLSKLIGFDVLENGVLSLNGLQLWKHLEYIIHSIEKNLEDPAGYGTIDFLTHDKKDALIIKYPRYDRHCKQIINNFLLTLKDHYSDPDVFKDVKVYLEDA